MSSSFQRLHRYYKLHWTDLPRRMATICIGVPILWRMFLDDWLRTVFFHGLLAVILWEWMHISKSYSLWWSLLLIHVPRELFLPSLVSAVAMSQIFKPTDKEKGSPFMTGSLLITIPFYSWMHVQSLGFGYVVSLLLVTWNVDTGSLIAGRMLGAKGQPLWLTRVSPGKSIAGLFGGLVGGLDSVKINLELDTMHAVYIGASLSVAASLGDLWESSLKRQWGVKDTSKLLPGHGGILDRFDSSLVAVLLYEFYINQGLV
ncbi:hypothetical protein MPSEU_000982100 [Mayamaea pseudoterrestris]|nr:hypothetical protein MPSEU_000982100 [Mayamaea pseudoterrestris]